MRTLLLELRPVGLGEVGLEDLLKQLGAGVSGRIRAEVNVHMQGNAILPMDVKLAFYRIAQEALNNIAKHSGADQVDIEIKSVSPPPSRKRRKAGYSRAIFSQSVSMSIRDNGCGFDPKSVIGEHLGLGIIRERASNTHIALSIKSKPSVGTQISLRWPRLKINALEQNMKKGQIRVVIADDHVMVRSGLRLFLLAFEDLKLWGEAANGQEAIRICAEKADVVLMDMVMPVVDGVSATERNPQEFSTHTGDRLDQFLRIGNDPKNAGCRGDQLSLEKRLQPPSCLGLSVMPAAANLRFQPRSRICFEGGN